MNALPPILEMQRAYQQKDARYNGVFFLGVRTTGIFCRPVCPARKPLPRNVEYFASAREALFAGYRPCKRCRPMNDSNQPPWLGDLLSVLDLEPGRRVREADLKARGLDPATVRRFFQKTYGMTFQAYARARRLSLTFRSIREGASVDDAVFESGYESPSGFREAFEKAFGTTPGACADRDCVSLAWVESPLGPLVAGACRTGVCLLEFSDRRMLETQLDRVRTLFRAPVLPGRHELLTELDRELKAYFSGVSRRFDVPLSFPGTPFQTRVWEKLLEIPYGETRSYQDLATSVGDPKAVRAVGRANGQNRIAIVIPCHRVVNKSGALGGYGGGLRRKEFLLNLERKHSSPNPNDKPSTSGLLF